MRCTLTLRGNEDYPRTAVTASLSDVRGLSLASEAAIRRAAQSAAQQAAPGPQLLAACSAAAEALTGLNHPDGSCAFCLQALEESFYCSPESVFQLMGCAHCFHVTCFSSWLAFLRSDLPPEGNLTDDLACPVCRAPVATADLQHARPALQRALLQLRHTSNAEAQGDRVPSDLLGRLREQQQRMAALWQRQQGAGGIIDVRSSEPIALSSLPRASPAPPAPAAAPPPARPPLPPPSLPGGVPELRHPRQSAAAAVPGRSRGGRYRPQPRPPSLAAVEPGGWVGGKGAQQRSAPFEFQAAQGEFCGDPFFNFQAQQHEREERRHDDQEEEEEDDR